MFPNFGRFEDELEPVEVWIDQLEKTSGHEFFLHVLLVFERSDSKRERIVAGTACEYYPKSNCGLMTYTAVNPAWQKRGIGSFMIGHVLTAINNEAKSAGKPGCDAIFLETNNPEFVSAKDDVIDPKVRHSILKKLGFWILSYKYVQPALTQDQQNCTTLLHACHKEFLTRENGKLGLKSHIILAFLTEFFTVLKGKKSLTTDSDYLDMKKYLTKNTFIPTVDQQD